MKFRFALAVGLSAVSGVQAQLAPEPIPNVRTIVTPYSDTYALTPEGYQGSHKDPALEIWLFDVRSKRRLERFSLRTPVLSIAATQHERPRLLIVNIAGQLDVYDGKTGAHLHTIGTLGDTPFMVHPIQ